MKGGEGMLWHKDADGSSVSEAKEPQKEKRLSPKDQMIEQLNQIEPGKEITFMLGEIYVKPFISVVRNEKGKKFSVFQDGRDATGTPAGNRGKFWDTNDAKEIASWVLGRGGGFYSA
jgi:hypothetical protein